MSEFWRKQKEGSVATRITHFASTLARLGSSVCVARANFFSRCRLKKKNINNNKYTAKTSVDPVAAIAQTSAADKQYY